MPGEVWEWHSSEDNTQPGTGNLSSRTGSTPTAPPGNRISAGDAKDGPGRAQDEGPALGHWAGDRDSKRGNKVMSFEVMGLISPHKNKYFPSPQ